MKRSEVPGASPLQSNAPTSDKHRSQSNARRFPKTARMLVLPVLLLLAGIAWILPAWRETACREAYLPQLQADALRNPFEAKLQALLGGRLMQAGDYAEAAEALRHAWAAGEQNSLLIRALAACSADQPARALADLNLGIRTLPQDADLRRTVDAVNGLGFNPSPANVAHTILPEGPEPIVARYSAGSWMNGLFEWWGRGHGESSGFTTRQRWATAQPNDAVVQRLWGQALARNRRFQEAIPVLQHSLTLAPSSPETHLALADTLDAAGLTSEATLEYLQCLKLRPNWLPALLGTGKTYLAIGLSQIAGASYLQATQVDPKSADAWIGLGRAYRNTGVDHDKSVAAFQTAERLAPQRDDYLDDYADALRQAVQWPAAEAVLRRRLRSAPDDPLAHYMLGMVMLNNMPSPERQTQAEAETRTALRLYPHNPLSDIQLALIELSRANPKEAVTLLTDALQTDPFNRNAMTILARAYRQTGRNDLADRVSKQADRLYQDQQRAQVLESEESKQVMDPKIHEELAALYQRVGQSKKGLYEESMARLIRSDPRKAVEELRKLRSVRDSAIKPK
ncbi:MAG: Cytochrome c biosis factor [Chthonomonadaceae bacterium]|nr:Cytochrome c biosis factor [Chthonomonadaceae bacterium]